jgi:hypothetical protein
LAGAQLRVQMDPVVGAPMSLLQKYWEHLGISPSVTQKNDDILSLPNLIGQVSMTFGSAWAVRRMDIKRASIQRALAPARVKVLIQPGQHRRCTTDLVEVSA